jgi:hypothetical protein
MHTPGAGVAMFRHRQEIAVRRCGIDVGQHRRCALKELIVHGTAVRAGLSEVLDALRCKGDGRYLVDVRDGERPVGTSVPQRHDGPGWYSAWSARLHNVTIGGIAAAAAIFKVRRLLLRDAVERHVVHRGAQIQVIVARAVNAKDRILHVTVGGA